MGNHQEWILWNRCVGKYPFVGVNKANNWFLKIISLKNGIMEPKFSSLATTKWTKPAPPFFGFLTPWEGGTPWFLLKGGL